MRKAERNKGKNTGVICIHILSKNKHLVSIHPWLCLANPRKLIRFLLYSQVPNKRGRGENKRGGWKWFDITIIGGGTIRRVLREIKDSVFLAKWLSFI